MELDTANWSGEGDFTNALIQRLQQLEHVEYARVEDAPASRSDTGYNFVSNEIFVKFAVAPRRQRELWLGFLPVTRGVQARAMTVEDLERTLTATAGIGPPDYADKGMLQYLRTERVIPPYQTRGYKLVELVRIYEVGSDRPLPNA